MSKHPRAGCVIVFMDSIGNHWRAPEFAQCLPDGAMDRRMPFGRRPSFLTHAQPDPKCMPSRLGLAAVSVTIVPFPSASVNR